MRNTIKTISFSAIGLFLMIMLISSITVINETEVGVKTTWGSIQKEELSAGINLVNPITSSIDTYKITEYPITLDNLTPKAGDNLALDDFDVTVYFEPNRTQIAEIMSSTSGSTALVGGDNYPAYHLVQKIARAEVYTEIAAQAKSLDINANREIIRANLQTNINSTVTSNKWGKITRVIIRSIKVAKAIDESIAAEVAEQNKLKRAQTRISVVKAKALEREEEAKGIAAANDIINGSLTPEYLQHEANQVLKRGLANGANTVVIPANMGNILLNVDASSPSSRGLAPVNPQ